MVVRLALLYGAECWLTKKIALTKDEGRRNENGSLDM